MSTSATQVAPSPPACATRIAPRGWNFKNLYYFFDARLELSQIADKVATNAHLDAPSDLSAVLWQELLDCGVIVVANKRRHDGVYFSRIRSSQLGQFFMRAGWRQKFKHCTRSMHTTLNIYCSILVSTMLSKTVGR